MKFEAVTHGFKDLEKALLTVDLKVDPVLGRALRGAAEPVKREVQHLASPYSTTTTKGVRIRRRGTAVRVEQGQRKTTGDRPQYGWFQMSHFFHPALDRHQAEVEASIAATIHGLIEGTF